MARINYFKGAETLEDVREKLIENLKEIGVKSKRFDTLYDQYIKACGEVGKKHKSRKGKIYERPVAISPETFIKLAIRLCELDGVDIKSEGTWIWLSGNTKAHKGELAELNKELAGTGTIRYSGKRSAWWFEDKVGAA